MKKTIFWVSVALLFAAVCGFLFWDVNGSTDKDVAPVDSVSVDSVVVVKDSAVYVTLDELANPNFVEHSIALDKEYMYANVNQDFKWYETCVLLSQPFDELSDYSITGVANIFQEKTDGIISVYLFAHVLTGADSLVIVANDFWVEDFDMCEADTVEFIGARNAFDQAKASGLQQPKNTHLVLRRQVGPVPNVNPQYIFGTDEDGQTALFVDAVTGEVVDTNPCFKR